ncbi:MAG: GlmL-related ornithine degradation protein [Bacillota bacterium]
MKVDLLIAEIGSTTTLVNAFNGVNTDQPEFVGQGLAPTSVLDGDVMIGLNGAIDDLKEKLDLNELDWDEFMATSSAAGGLKMTVHGLVKDMTVKAAEEAALGAGAVIKQVTAGKLRERRIEELLDIKPNIILLAGGVDYGEEEVILHNAHKLAKIDIDVPVIYAGNKVLQEEVKEIFEKEGKEILIADNVYPEIDTLNIEETRKLIHNVFARHIVRAPGMKRIESMLTIDMMPTPGAVMQGSKLLKEEIGNLVTLDVGGATTDVHSVTTDSGDVKEILLSPEPEAKRTVEGDLGVFLNAPHVYEMLKEELYDRELEIEKREDLAPLPRDKKEEEYVHILAEKAAVTAVKRHAGKFKDYFGPSGRMTVAEGKDLTAVKWIIGTGGALTRLTDGEEILKSVRGKDRKLLIPTKDANTLVDKDYIMASMGVMSQKYPEAAKKLLLESVKNEKVEKYLKEEK